MNMMKKRATKSNNDHNNTINTAYARSFWKNFSENMIEKRRRNICEQIRKIEESDR
jgi:hypothetical protein